MDKVSGIFMYSVDSFIGRFILTFILLHSLHYFSTMFYSSYCLNISFLGYFKSIINGHGPICHILLNISYHAQSNIYNLLKTSAVGTGITIITNKIFKKINSE